MATEDDRRHVLCTLPGPEPAGILEEMRKEFPMFRFTYYRALDNNSTLSINQGVPDEIWKDVSVLFTLGPQPPRPELAPKLEYVQMFSAGTNHMQHHWVFQSSRIPLCTTAGMHGPTIGEYVMMQLLVNAHAYRTLHDWQAAGSWGPPDGGSAYTADSPVQNVREWTGQRLGILGYGGIGRHVGRLGVALGMDVVVCTRTPRADDAAARRHQGYTAPGSGDPDGTAPRRWFSGATTADLHAFLAYDLDALVVAAPLTDATRTLIGPAELRLLERRNALIVNVARGQLLDADALIRSLEAFVDNDRPENRGKPHRPGIGRAGLRGAALDVTDPEPLPAGHPLFTAPNCVVTPHIAGQTSEAKPRAFDVFRTNLHRFQKGEPLLNQVDRARGY